MSTFFDNSVSESALQSAHHRHGATPHSAVAAMNAAPPRETAYAYAPKTDPARPAGPGRRVRPVHGGHPGHGRRRQYPALAGQDRPPRRRSRTAARPPPTPSTATPVPAGPARSATRSGCRSTSARTATVCQVVLHWEAAYATAFQIQVSADGDHLDAPSTRTTTGTGGTQTLTVTGTGRYVRMYGTARATGYGYSLWEFVVYTGGGTTPAPTARTGPATAGHDHLAVQAGDGLLVRGRQRSGRGARRADHHPLVQPVQRSTVDLQVDLGGTGRDHRRGAQLGGRVRAPAYHIDVSNDATHLDHHLHHDHRHTAASRRSTSPVPAATCGMYGTARATGYGYSLWEFQVLRHASTPSSSTPPMLSGPTRPPATTGQFQLVRAGRRARWSPTPAGRRCPGRPSPGAAQLRRSGSTSAAPTTTSPQSGNLLDLYTKVAEPTGTSYTPTWDIPDRWTYKWYVVVGQRIRRHAPPPTSARSACTCRPSSTVADGIARRQRRPRPQQERHASSRTRTGASRSTTRVNDLLGRMTLEEKAYQMFYNAQVVPAVRLALRPGASARDLQHAPARRGRHPAGHPVRLGRRHHPRVPDHVPDAERAGRRQGLRAGLQARRHAAQGAARGRHPRRARPAGRGRHQGALPAHPGGQRRERRRRRGPGAGARLRPAGRTRAQPAARCWPPSSTGRARAPAARPASPTTRSPSSTT